MKVEEVVYGAVDGAAEEADAERAAAGAYRQVFAPVERDLIVEIVIEQLDDDGAVLLESAEEVVEEAVVAEGYLPARAGVDFRIDGGRHGIASVGECEVEPVEIGGPHRGAVEPVEARLIEGCAVAAVDETRIQSVAAAHPVFHTEVHLIQGEGSVIDPEVLVPVDHVRFHVSGLAVGFEEKGGTPPPVFIESEEIHVQVVRNGRA